MIPETTRTQHLQENTQFTEYIQNKLQAYDPATKKDVLELLVHVAAHLRPQTHLMFPHAPYNDFVSCLEELKSRRRE
jgi:hypothetical protein